MLYGEATTLHIYFAGPLFTPNERRYIDESAARLRRLGFEVFVPHENFLSTTDISAEKVFAKDLEGLEMAHALVAVLDGPMVDDGTACEVGLFYALMQRDPTKKGIVGLLTDTRLALRDNAAEGKGLNLFVLGCIQRVGSVVDSVHEAVDLLQCWREELGENVSPAPG